MKKLHYACNWSTQKIPLVLLCISFSFYTASKQNRINATSVKRINRHTPLSKKEIWVTVFVHGIMSIQPHLTSNNVAKVISDKVEDSSYYDAVYYMRHDNFFFKNQPMQGIGLCAVDPHNIVAGNASGAIARLYSISTEKTSMSSQANRYYTFGWYGVISPTVRRKAGAQLCCALAQEVMKLRSQGFIPRIRVIGYSHGGNVALNMALVASRYRRYLPRIDELILMGVPIKPENEHLVSNPVFKRVYNLFSTSDYIQPLDCFASQCFFSKRTFASRKGFRVPKKVLQIQIKITKSMTCDGTTTIEHPACISDIVAKGNARFQRNRSPGHIELWFFGWTPNHYRDTFLLYPLPILAFVPQIIHYAKKYAKEHNTHPEDTVITDLRPDEALMIVRKAGCNTTFSFVPFLSNTDIDTLAHSIVPFKPKKFTKKMYDEHTNKAIARAKELRCGEPVS